MFPLLSACRCGCAAVKREGGRLLLALAVLTLPLVFTLPCGLLLCQHALGFIPVPVEGFFNIASNVFHGLASLFQITLTNSS